MNSAPWNMGHELTIRSVAYNITLHFPNAAPPRTKAIEDYALRIATAVDNAAPAALAAAALTLWETCTAPQDRVPGTREGVSGMFPGLRRAH